MNSAQRGARHVHLWLGSPRFGCGWRKLDLAQSEDITMDMAEAEARKGGSKCVTVRHVVLALARHPIWQGALQEMGLRYDVLVDLLSDERFRAEDTSDLDLILSEAMGLCGTQDAAEENRGPCGACLLQSIVNGTSAVGHAIKRASQARVPRVLRRWRVLCPSGQSGRFASAMVGIRRWLNSLYFAALRLSLLVALSGVALYHLLEPTRFFEWFTVITFGGAALVLFSWVVGAPIYAVISGLLAPLPAAQRKGNDTQACETPPPDNGETD